MLNCRRNKQAAWFHNYPKMCFLPIEFLPNSWYYILFYKKPQEKCNKVFSKGQRELVRGEIYPNKKLGGGGGGRC